MSDAIPFDAYTPAEIARRIETAGVNKARMPLLPLLLLGGLAGLFVGLGAVLSFIVRADPALSPAVAAVASGVVFSMGLLMVLVAGAELFTGNHLLVMAWADGRIAAWEVLRNWGWVSLANGVGATALALMVFWSGQPQAGSGAVATAVMKAAWAKQSLPWFEALWRGVLCNVLVCLAVWMAMAGRSVADKFFAIVWPITAFVAAGFEHSVANMFLFPLAGLLQQNPVWAAAVPGPITWAGALSNLAVVITGNLVGGSVLVGGIYHLIYRQVVPRGPAP